MFGCNSHFYDLLSRFWLNSGDSALQNVIIHTDKVTNAAAHNKKMKNLM